MPTTTMITPVSLLSIFCATMAAISVGRLAMADDRDPVDAGTATIVVGITVLSLLWTAVEHSVTALSVLLVLGLVGTGLMGIGLAVVVRFWDA